MAKKEQLDLVADTSVPAPEPLLVPETGWGIRFLDEFFAAMDALDDPSRVSFGDWRYLSASASHVVVEAHRRIQQLGPGNGYRVLMLVKQQFAALTSAVREGSAADVLKAQIHDLAAQINSMQGAKSKHKP